MKYRTKLGPQIKHAPELEMGVGMRTFHVSQVGLILVVALIVMGVFNSEAFVDWAMNLPVGPVTDRILMVAGAWHDLMERLGCTRLHDLLREIFLWFKGL